MTDCDQNITKLTYTTRRKLSRVSYVWKIANFSYCPEKCGDELKSPTFSATSADTDVKWHLTLYPKGRNEEAKDYLSIYLHCESTDVVVNYKIAILGEKQKSTTDVSEEKFARGPFVHQFTKSGQGHGYPKFIELTKLNDEANGLLPGDTLNLLCEFSYAGKEVEVVRPVVINDRPALVDFGKLLDDGQFSDCILTVGDAVFKVHKLVLMARSDVFRAMFQLPLREQQKGEIAITDFDSEVVYELLQFIYTDTTPKLPEMSAELLRAAEKYQLGRLKQMCECALYDALTVDNVCDTLLLADMHRADQLKKHAEHYLKDNQGAVMKTEGCKRLGDSHPRLLITALRADRA